MPEVATIDRSTSDASRSATRSDLDLVTRADFLGRLERECRREDREQTEERLLLLAQELIAPLDHPRERALALSEPLRPAAEKVEAMPEAVCDLPRRQAPGARGRQLEGQREAVEAATDLGDRPQRGLVQLELATHRARAVDEEANGIGLLEPSGPASPPGTPRGSTSATAPGTSSRTRLVAMMRTSGHDDRSETARSPPRP